MNRLAVLPLIAFALAGCPPEEDGDGDKDPPAKKLSVTVVKSGDGRGSITSAPTGIDCATDCDEQQHDFVIGGNVVLSAEPARDALFAGWSCDVDDGRDTRGGPDSNVSAGEPDDPEGSDIVCTAEFRQLTTMLVVFSAPEAGVLGQGNVTGTAVDNEGVARIDCNADGSGDCESGYFVDESETLTATAEDGSEFCQWRICATSTEPTIELVMDADRNCEAVFALGTCPP